MGLQSKATPEASHPAPGGSHSVRREQYPQLVNKVYLDYGGTTPYAATLLHRITADFEHNLYGNPHSDSLPSLHTSKCIESVRLRALHFFKADPKDFDIVFTANATSAIKLLLECLKDYTKSECKDLWYGYHQDSHTSLVGGRELADIHDCFEDDGKVDEWVDCGRRSENNDAKLHLLAYPGQSNMTGRRLPLRWPGRLRGRQGTERVLTLMDAASLASTTALELSHADSSPDFVAISFYKIFGLPDLGALLVQKRHFPLFQRRRYFGGGTVEMVTSKPHAWHALKQGRVHEALEDGTLPFHSIIALGHAIDVHEEVYGPDPMQVISKNTTALSSELRRSLLELRHDNGLPAVKLYGDNDIQRTNSDNQGAVLALNILRADGGLVGHKEVERCASEHNIYVRSGSLCNPGGIAIHLGWDSKDLRQAYDAGHRCSNPLQFALGRPTGVVRVSLGAASTVSDIHAFVHFVQQMYVRSEDLGLSNLPVPSFMFS